MGEVAEISLIEVVSEQTLLRGAVTGSGVTGWRRAVQWRSQMCRFQPGLVVAVYSTALRAEIAVTVFYKAQEIRAPGATALGNRPRSCTDSAKA